MSAAEAVGFPVCVSTIHTPPVRATVRGTWLEAISGREIPDVWYCEKCASTAEAYRLFIRDEVEAWDTNDPR